MSTGRRRDTELETKRKRNVCTEFGWIPVRETKLVGRLESKDVLLNQEMFVGTNKERKYGNKPVLGELIGKKYKPTRI